MPSLVLRHLVFSLDATKYQDFPLVPGSKSKIGRDRRSDFVFTREDDLLVSKRHAVIEVYANGGMFVLDKNTLNGTYINGTKVPAGVLTQLEQGDIISFGTVEKLARNTTSISFLVTEAEPPQTTERKRKRAESTIDQALLDEIACSVCSDPYLHPVIIGCGHTFCDDCLLTWIEQCKNGTVTCPECREPLTCNKIIPCRALRGLVERVVVQGMDTKDLERRMHRSEIMKNKRVYTQMRDDMKNKNA